MHHIAFRETPSKSEISGNHSGLLETLHPPHGICMIVSPCIFYARALSATVLIKAFVRAGAVITAIPGPDSTPSQARSCISKRSCSAR
ncbi:hypothetical protein Zmor_015882 [Zophobas morio]|uniref:Uncharacterized protein n=1 Tax=Zophobas morio TaxID=2755281 RepID=A0AA38IHL5_9CUCU|nr:hypothetical protein Zmor_015879 [Zophobas morio]KAJ3656837.1 hypothetical protein Zmor_015882 [Zophobas morio]